MGGTRNGGASTNKSGDENLLENNANN